MTIITFVSRVSSTFVLYIISFCLSFCFVLSIILFTGAMIIQLSRIYYVREGLKLFKKSLKKLLEHSPASMSSHMVKKYWVTEIAGRMYDRVSLPVAL